MPGQEHKPHLLVKSPPSVEHYQKPGNGGGGLKVPPRQRASHSQRLLGQLDNIQRMHREQERERQVIGISTGRGIVLRIEGPPPKPPTDPKRKETTFKVDLERMLSIDGAELLTVKPRNNGGESMVVRLSNSAINEFIGRLNEYGREAGSKADATLMSSIETLGMALLEAFWSDPTERLPKPGEPFFWEVWLRQEDPATPVLDIFRRDAGIFGLTVFHRAVAFPDRCVVLAHGTLEAMSQSAELLCQVAELRSAPELAADYMAFEGKEQWEWVRELVERVRFPDESAPAICILDAGVRRGHPLLEPALSRDDLLTCDPEWGVDDSHDKSHQWGTHGTRMAGLCLYGDLSQAFSSTGPVVLDQRLESVKILPPHGANKPEHYASLMLDAVGQAEANAPERERVFVCAVAEKAEKDRGRPSAWSAEIDQLAFGGELSGGLRRLIILSAGNNNFDQITSYPNSNLACGVRGPGQSWNALTVGAYTGKAVIPDSDLRAWKPIARPGGLGPVSTTSLSWPDTWPVKPDILMEGGNLATTDGGEIDALDQLQLLTTARISADFERPITTFGETSAASALAARMAMRIKTEYPDLWPETVRALMVHSAEWTDEMLRQFLPVCRPLRQLGLFTPPLRPADIVRHHAMTTSKKQLRTLWRSCGWGVPRLQDALYSARSTLTLIAQNSLEPFEVGVPPRMKDIHVYKLPWPTDALEELHETPVELRVTLSYFVEPSPGQRGWRYKFQYASHGLRFDVQTATESPSDFQKRLNEKAREEEDQGRSFVGDSNGWLVGPRARSAGSLHHDRWFGMARDLADRGMIAVYPVIGWWRQRPELRKVDQRARYALVVSIRVPESHVDIDIYTPVAQQIRIAQRVENVIPY